ncbi:amidohydrolase [Nonomuraea spiralis]|uniref:Peptidase M20 domain-containing protein 2 n=1 Tax=Nonomuraea spiralis TaxID=46182 RepID=A0ABV5IJU4_9ACTN|nr:amidohydrolase [Nonomuraea spiralis]GGT08259.1 amidohydrolase [Nonomuraea spiralis]
MNVKDLIAGHVRAHAPELVALSHRIHAHPETAFEEHRAAAWTAETLQAGGFTVTAGAGGLPTAFSASLGTGPLTVAFCAEYDALPGLGHACGHNVIAAAATGAGLALAPLADELGLTVRVVGTPAEERGGGKALLLEAGVFDGAHAAMMVHPGSFETVRFRSFALGTLEAGFTGRAAHATLAPHEGRNAADAMTLAQVAIGLLRQQLPRDRHVHGVVTSAGEAPNVIPARSTASYEIRAAAARDLAELRARVESCFRGAAVATGCELRLTRPEPDYLDFRDDAVLAGLYAANAAALGRPAPVEREPFAMTDMANVSHVIPAIHPMLDIGSGGAVPHDAEFAAAAAAPAADRALLEAAVLLARTAADLALSR